MSGWNQFKETGLYDRIVNDGELPSTEVQLVVPERTLYRVAFVAIAVIIVMVILVRITKPITKSK
jgi:hypothetical protein